MQLLHNGLSDVCAEIADGKWHATSREIEIFAKRGITIEKVMRGSGCAVCNMTGYRGRIAIHEVLVLDDEMRDVINRGGSSAQI